MDIQALIEKDPKKLRKANYTVKIMPWFMGASNDLMFYIAINTLFLTTAKGLTAAQITFLTTVSGTICIVLQRLILAVIHRIGNTWAVRAGTLMLLTGSVLLTFGPTYPVIMIGHVFYSSSFLIKQMDNVMLQSNLDYLDQHDGYLKKKNLAGIAYSVITMVVALVGGPLFKIHPYLPMYLCIGVCVLNVILSFTMADVNEKPHQPRKSREKGGFGKLLLFIILAYGLGYAAISIGQNNVKLLIQYELFDFFDAGTTASIFSVILVLSRLSRILSNLCFYRIYQRCRDRLLHLLPIACGSAFVLAVIGYFIPSLYPKFILMTLGFCIILGIRDLWNTYINGLAMKKTAPEAHQNAISYLQLSRKVGETSISFVISLLLIRVEMIWVIFVLIGFAVASLITNAFLYKKVQ
ncbi:MAG: hypothetical protein IJD09_00555 [Clostridia bacterium]|nr:hypothetical protein [Clostridia bacterium]